MIKPVFALAFAAIFSTCAFAGPDKAIWHGHVTFNTSMMPNPSDPNQAKLISAQILAQSQIRMTLTFRNDHRFSLVTISNGSQLTTTGTWAQSGYQLTIQPIESGQPGTPRTFTFAQNGRSFSYTQSPTTITFSK